MARPRSRALNVLRLTLGILMVVGVLRLTLFTVYRVAGSSMEDTLIDGDRILVCDVAWLTGPPAPGDTVIARVEGEVLVKRVAAGPGDTVSMLFGALVRNGKVVAEDIPAPYRRVESFADYRLGPDEYFLLGDHRRVSIDSREFGPVQGGQILGEVLLRLGRDGVSPVRALALQPDGR